MSVEQEYELRTHWLINYNPCGVFFLSVSVPRPSTYESASQNENIVGIAISCIVVALTICGISALYLYLRSRRSNEVRNTSAMHEEASNPNVAKE